MANLDSLIGKQLWAFLSTKRTRCGFRSGRVESYKADRNGQLQFITIRLYNGGKKHKGWNGKRVRLTPLEFRHPMSGVQYHRKFRPVSYFEPSPVNAA